MKKIFYKLQLSILALLLFSDADAQILRQGSIVATHRSGYIGTPTGNSAVVLVLDASNTTAIPATPSPMFSGTYNNRYTWTSSTPNPRPSWITGMGPYNWDYNTLGAVFGITLDNAPVAGNIYVSNSSIYGGEAVIHHDSVYRINGTTGQVNVMFGFNGTNPSRGIGNIKYFTTAGSNYIVASWWEDGKIYAYKEASPGVWILNSSFAPQFGFGSVNNNIIPYGVAIRNTATGLRLFYGEFSMMASPTVSSRIFSIPLNPGTLIPASPTEQLEFSVPVTTYSAAGFFMPVSDISFSQDNKRMLVSQQTLYGTNFIGSHRSRVQEYKDLTPGTIPGGWVAVGKYPSGYNSQVPYPGYPTASASSTSGNNSYNAAGGVTYWNKILFTNQNSGAGGATVLSCDTTILYTSDWIYRSCNTSPCTMASGDGPPSPTEVTTNFAGISPDIYGVQGLPSKNNFLTDLDAFSYSLKISEFNSANGGYDKTNLGDIEAYNPPLNCTPQCDCGKWDSIGYNNNSHWWLNNTTPPPPIPTISFNQGAATGVLFPYYKCSGGPCDATFTYEILSNTGTVTTIPGNPTGGLDLGQAAINNLPCGSYFLTITPTCNGIKCPPIRIPISIICPPACPPCAGNVTINQGQINVTAQSNVSNPNPVSTLTTSFTLTSTVPVTEVRVLIDEFRLTTTTGNENCILCKNKPQTWANINAGSLSGVAFQPMTSPASFPPALEKDIRELVFNNGAGTFFSLTGNTLNLTLGVPGVTGLNCCTLKAEVCIKFIIRDVNCCEKEILKCFSFNLQ